MRVALRLLPCLALAGPAVAQTVQLELAASDAGVFEDFGLSVALSGETALVGKPLDSAAGSGSGAAYVFERTPGGWTERAKLVAADTAKFDQLGHAVDLFEDTAVVGAWRKSISGVGSLVGAVYVFERGPSGWVQTAKLTASDAAENRFFGICVSILGDRIAVASYNDIGQASDEGRVYVFERSGSTWAEVAILTASDAAGGDELGCALEVGADLVFAGAQGADIGGVSGAGAVYVFERTPGGWVEAQKIPSPAPAVGGLFGGAIALSGDTAVLGYERHYTTTLLSGAAYVHERGPTGWSQRAVLIQDDPKANEGFGSSVAIDGDRLVVGARRGVVDGIVAGDAHLFQRAGDGWVPLTTIASTDPQAIDFLGASIAMDGEWVLVGAPQADAPHANSGAAWVASFTGLGAAPETVSASAGGSQDLALLAGPERAGLPYLVLGSTSGTGSPIPIDGLSIPLVFDAYTSHTLLAPNAPPLAGGAGLLDAAGAASATFSLAPGSSPTLVGVGVHHAFVVIELLPSLLHVVYASDAAGLEIGT